MKPIKNKRNLMLLSLLITLLSSAPAWALKNPAAVYCHALGYEYQVLQSKTGWVGHCVIPKVAPVRAWQFLQGQSGQEFNACSRYGYKTQIVKDAKLCQSIFSEFCAVCMTKAGAIEASQLLKLDFNQSQCGDGTCGMPENFKTCPKDCPSGSADHFCDAQSDKICDPDCDPKQDPDCN